jgi:hypothetical protein
MVLYGIKVKNTILIDNVQIFFIFTHVGESNTGYNCDKYTCSFSKMIQYWREIWSERTNGSTDIQFPFGFVQVSFTQNYMKNTFIHRLIEKKSFYL